MSQDHVVAEHGPCNTFEECSTIIRCGHILAATVAGVMREQHQPAVFPLNHLLRR